MIRTCFLKDGDWKVKDGIFIHSSPRSSGLYDTMWNSYVADSYDESNIDDRYWSERVSRRLELIAMINPTRIHGTHRSDEEMQEIKHAAVIEGGRVLDCCSGAGAWSIAALEIGANEVVSCDGSLTALRDMPARIKNSNTLSHLNGRKIIRIQADANYLSDIFTDEYFDLSFIRMAIHHLKNPFKTMYDLARVTRLSGNISFDCFLVSCTSDITRDMREYFLKKDLSNVYNFLSIFGTVKTRDNDAESINDIIDIKDVISGDVKLSREYDKDIDFLASMSNKYGIEMVSGVLHLENFQTDYIHNLKDEDILSFCVGDLGLRLVDRIRYKSGVESLPDRGTYTFKVPHGWAKEHATFPTPLVGREFK